MTLRKAIEVIAELAKQEAIKQYAITGAVAALNYIQPTLTEDLDILVSVGDFEQRKSGFLLLTPIEDALARMGYIERSELGISIEGWPVQFLPVASALDEEALATADEVDLGVKFDNEPSIKARVLRAEYLVAIALKVGRLKDLARVDAFLTQKAVDVGALKTVLQRFDLLPAWSSFCVKAGIPDILR